ncbi:MAG: hypothetical protein HWN67_05285, partial [Candidatus Helarchaeota archaeon]|nr:hypothetical protein [Candidatus Helarchaeota archaeon]
KERAEDLELLDKAADDNIIIVKGVYDKVELVMDAVGLEYIFLEQEAVGRVDFRPDQILIINCPGGKIDEQGINDIRDFVNNGGFLLSTDWVLKNVLEKAFPGYVEFNGNQTGDEVVGIEVFDKSHPFIKGMFSDVSNPQWWLEGSSYPIRILNKKAVKVLISSKEMKKTYGDDPVVVFFNYGKGKVMHMLSHYYLQRTETKTARQKKSAKAYAAEMKLSKEDIDLEELEDISLGEVESAYTTAQFIGNLIVEKQKENVEFEKTEDKKPKKGKKKKKS